MNQCLHLLVGFDCIEVIHRHPGDAIPRRTCNSGTNHVKGLSVEDFVAVAMVRLIAAGLVRPALAQKGVLRGYAGPPHSTRSLARATFTRPADDRVRCRADGSGGGLHV